MMRWKCEDCGLMVRCVRTVARDARAPFLRDECNEVPERKPHAFQKHRTRITLLLDEYIAGHPRFTASEVKQELGLLEHQAKDQLLARLERGELRVVGEVRTRSQGCPAKVYEVVG